MRRKARSSCEQGYSTVSTLRSVESKPGTAAHPSIYALRSVSLLDELYLEIMCQELIVHGGIRISLSVILVVTTFSAVDV